MRTEASSRHRARVWAALAALWRRPVFAAALAGTIAAALPLALLAGGNADTFALWHDSGQVPGQKIEAGDLDAGGAKWIGWKQVTPVGSPDAAAPAGQQGTCLTAPDLAQPDKCEDQSLPLDQFVAMPGDKIELVGQFESILGGDNIAAWIKVGWADLPEGQSNPGEVTAVFGLGARQFDAADQAVFAPVVDGLAVGGAVWIATTSDPAATGTTAGNVKVAYLPKGIHEASHLVWRVTVTVEVKDTGPGADPFPYAWGDPLDDAVAPPAFQLPALTWELEQIRAGE
ncbi:MAG: hypothetical protein LBD70_06020, partial [Bifidobacteriaceae bacterium]|nr:hypothetical protein [Bifidobacteriaceae bacterium]